MFYNKQVDYSFLSNRLAPEITRIDSCSLDLMNSPVVENLFTSNLIKHFELSDCVENLGVTHTIFTGRMLIELSLTHDSNGVLSTPFLDESLSKVVDLGRKIAKENRVSDIVGGYEYVQSDLFSSNTKLSNCSDQFKAMTLGNFAGQLFSKTIHLASPTMSCSAIQWSIATAFAFTYFNHMSYQLLIRKLQIASLDRSEPLNQKRSRFLLNTLTSTEYLDVFKSADFTKSIDVIKETSLNGRLKDEISVDDFLYIGLEGLMKHSIIYNVYRLAHLSGMFDTKNDLLSFLSGLDTMRLSWSYVFELLVQSDGDISPQSDSYNTLLHQMTLKHLSGA